MNIAIVVFALALIAASLITVGIGLLLGLPAALIATGLFIFGAAARLQKVMTPSG
jgi:hypothetical protein